MTVREAFWQNNDGEVLRWTWNRNKLTIERFAGYEFPHAPWTYSLKSGRDQWRMFREYDHWRLLKPHEVALVTGV